MPSTTVQLSALDNAFAQIEQITKDEVTFDVGGHTQVTLRVMIPEEEDEVQQYAAKYTPDQDAITPAALTKYADEFFLAVLAGAIAQVNDLDLRNVQYVETGEKLPNDVAVKVSRFEAMRGIVGRWTRHVRSAMFKKYAELLARVELKADGIVQYDPVDYDAEIERLTKRLEELKGAKERQNQTQRSAFAQQVQAFATVDAEENPEAAQALVGAMIGHQGSQEAPAPENPQEAPSAPVQAPSRGRASIIPTETLGADAPAQVAPPPPPPVQHVSAAPAVAQDEQGNVVIPKQQMAHPTPPERFEDMEDSFMGGDEADEVAAANRRMAAMRRGQVPVPPSVSVAAQMRQQGGMGGRVPPHLQARQPELQQAERDQTEALAGQKAVAVGQTAEGVEVYRLPTQELTERGLGPEPGAPRPRVPLNQTGGSRNPRFNPPGT